MSMYVRGIEAIKLYMPAPATNTQIDIDVKEERGREEPTVTKMSSVERYGQEWTRLLQCLKENPESIRDQAFNGDLKVSKFRSLYWALLLRVLSADYRDWLEQRQQQRQRYEKLKQEFIKNPHDIEVPDDNPLSQSQESVWNQYFSDQELFAVIKQDVVRTFPGVDFFRKPIIQNAMSNILFYYAREHPYMCYRQGMHEVLAPILFVMYGDHLALLHFKEFTNALNELENATIDDILLDVLNPSYLEADSYSIFSRLMSSIESYYRIKNFTQDASGYVQTQNVEGSTKNVEVIGQLNFIRDKILAKEDLHLHNYLLKLDIPLHIFGIRWLRLLFGREFSLLDLLVLWDAIFADSDRFVLPDYILVAMLIRIREKLLLSDQTTCLTYLMRYPTNVDVNLILRHALHMLMPKKFDLPPNAFVYFTLQQQQQHQQLQQTLPAAPKSLQNVPRRPPLATDLQQRNTSLQRSRSTSLGEPTVPEMDKEIALLQARNAAHSATAARVKLGVNNNYQSIMEGYAKDSPELSRLELMNAQTVISIARRKLQSYLSVIRRNVSRNSSEELTQALDGIEELCSFLDVKFMFPVQATTAPVDPADEADEQQRQQKAATKQLNRQQIDVAAVADTLEVTRKTRNSLEMDTAANVGDHISTTSSTTPSNNSNAGFTYERPDNSFMVNTTRRLGNLREIELVTIAPSEKVEQPLVEGPQTNEGQIARNELPLSDPLRHERDHNEV